MKEAWHYVIMFLIIFFAVSWAGMINTEYQRRKNWEDFEKMKAQASQSGYDGFMPY